MSTCPWCASQAVRVGLRATVPAPTPVGGPAAALGRYVVLGRLGAGGMGDVLLVEDAELGRELAAKTVRDDHHGAVMRFLQEARITGQLEHPNIVPVHELGVSDDGVAFFTMKRVRGQDLAGAIEAAVNRLAAGASAATELARLLEIVLKVCDAVAFAHSRGVIHRDLKPANVMVGEFGEVLVCDWGLAKLLHGGAEVERSGSPPPQGGAGATRDGSILGTPAYMAPEQAAGRISELDARSDVYALGAILYHVLALRPPFDDAHAEQVLVAVREGRLEPPSRRSPGRLIPWELEAVVLRAMALAPGDRYASARALREDLALYQEGRTLVAARYRPWQRASKWVRRNKLPAALLGIAALLGLAVGWNRLASERTRRLLRARAVTAAGGGALSEALVAAEMSLELGPDAELRRLARQTRARLERVQRFARLEREVLAPVRRRIDQARPLLYLPWVDPLAVRAQLRTDLGRLAAAARQPVYQEFAEPWALLGGGWLLLDLPARAAVALAEAERRAPQDAYVQYLLGRLCVRQVERGWADHTVRRLRADDHAAWTERASRHFERAARWLAGRALEREIVAIHRLHRSDRAAALARSIAGCERFAAEVGVERLWLIRARLAPHAEVVGLLERALRIRPHSAWVRFLLAARHLELRDHERGRVQLEQVLRLTPELVPARILRAVCHSQAGELEQARTLLDAVLAEHPDHVVALNNRALDWVMARRLDRALADLDRVVALEPRWSEAHVNRADVLMRLGKPQAALAVLDMLGERAPRHEAAARLRATLSLELGRLPEALAAARRAVEVAPQSARAHCVLGEVRLHERRPAEALKRFEHALTLAPDLVSARRGRARARALTGDLQGAAADYEQLIAIEPQVAGHHRGHADVLRRQGRPARALAAVNRSIELAPRSALARHLRADLHTAAGRLREALADYDAAIVLQPRDAELFLLRGQLRARLGPVPQALADYGRAIALDPRRPGPYYLRGSLLAAAASWVAAAADFTRVLSLTPDDHDARLARAGCRQRQGDLEGALSDYTTLVERQPTQAEYRIHQAMVLSRLGRHREARISLDRAAEQAPIDWRVWLALGRARLAAGDRPGARAALDRALRLAPPRRREEIEAQRARAR